MMDLVDRVTADTRRQFRTSNGLVANQEAVNERRKMVRKYLVREFEEVDKLFREVNRMEAARRRKRIFQPRCTR